MWSFLHPTHCHLENEEDIEIKVRYKLMDASVSEATKNRYFVLHNVAFTDKRMIKFKKTKYILQWCVRILYLST